MGAVRWFCRAVLNQKACIMSWANLLCISVGQLQTCMKGKFCTGVTVVTHGCCQLCLQSSTEPETMFSGLGKPAVHQCWAIADLYERQICTGVTVVTKGCCQLLLQSSTEPETIFSVLGKPAVHQCWAITNLYERQVLHRCDCSDTWVLSDGFAEQH